METPPKYDSRKSYTWPKEAKFEMTGAEFGLILNTFRAILNTEEAARILLANQCNQIIERIMSNSVEAGIVVEDVPVTKDISQTPKV